MSSCSRSSSGSIGDPNHLPPSHQQTIVTTHTFLLSSNNNNNDDPGSAQSCSTPEEQQKLLRLISPPKCSSSSSSTGKLEPGRKQISKSKLQTYQNFQSDLVTLLSDKCFVREYKKVGSCDNSCSEEDDDDEFDVDFDENEECVDGEDEDGGGDREESGLSFVLERIGCCGGRERKRNSNRFGVEDEFVDELIVECEREIHILLHNLAFQCVISFDY